MPRRERTAWVTPPSWATDSASDVRVRFVLTGGRYGSPDCEVEAAGVVEGRTADGRVVFLELDEEAAVLDWLRHELPHDPDGLGDPDRDLAEAAIDMQLREAEEEAEDRDAAGLDEAWERRREAARELGR